MRNFVDTRLKSTRSVHGCLLEYIIKHPYLTTSLANSVFFGLITGGSIIMPSNTRWLLWGDSASNYFGWEFFRRGPLNVWPIGESPFYGVGYVSSIVYTDSIPLLAIPLKFLLSGYGNAFQYFGLWIYCCFVGQGVAAIRLLKQLKVDKALLVPLGFIFTLTPALLYRMAIAGYGHLALAGHFLILLALGLMFQRFSHRYWFPLIISALLVHAYLFIIVLVFYIFATIREIRLSWAFDGRKALLKTVKTSVLVIVGILGIAYASGYFMGEGLATLQFGWFAINPFTFVDPSVVNPNTNFASWSRLIMDLPGESLSYEGFAFLGTGSFLMLIFNLREFKTILLSKVALLLAPSTFLLALSLTNRVSIHGREMVLPLPSLLIDALGIFRVTSRFVWPMMYVLILTIILTADRSYQLRKKWTILLITIVLVVQIFDSFPAYRAVHNRFTEFSHPPSALLSTKWEGAVIGKSCLITVPVQHDGLYGHNFAELALNNGMTTNAANHARVSELRLQDLSQLLRKIIDSGELEKDCLYVLVVEDSTSTANLIRKRYTELGITQKHIIEVIDNFVVVYLR